MSNTNQVYSFTQATGTCQSYTITVCVEPRKLNLVDRMIVDYVNMVDWYMSKIYKFLGKRFPR